MGKGGKKKAGKGRKKAAKTKSYGKEHKKRETKRRTRDHDQIHDDLKNPKQYENMPLDEDLPGEGQFYCISCARHFMHDVALQKHFTTTLHKRRLKHMKDDPWTQAESEAAGVF